MTTRLFLSTIALLLLMPALHEAFSQEPDWRTVTGGTPVGTPAIAQSGRIYLAVEDRYLYALNENGTIAWRFDLGTIPSTSALVSPYGNVLVGTRDRILRGVASSGQLRFRMLMSAPVHSMTVNRGGVVHALLEDGSVVALTDRGVRIYAADLGLSRAAGLASAAGRINWAVGTGSRAGPGAGATIVAFDGSGTVLFRHDMPAAATAHAVHTGAALLVGSSDGTLLRLNPGGGSTQPYDVRQLYGADSAIRAIRTLIQAGDASGAIALLDGAGQVHVLSGEGEPRWSAAPPGGQVADIAFTEGGELLVATEDARIFVMGLDGALREELHVPDGEGLIAVNAAGGAAVAADRSWISAGFSVGEGRFGGWRAAAGPGDNSAALAGSVTGADGAWWDEHFDYLYLRDHLFSLERADRERALEEIANRVNHGDLRGSYEYVVELLRSAAVEPFRHPRYAEGSVVNDFPEQRRLAVSLFAEVAGSGEHGFLLRALQVEYDWGVRAEIVRALGEIGSDGGGAVSRVLLELLREQPAHTPNATFTAAVLEALHMIRAYDPAARTDAITEALIWIRDSNVARALRERAVGLLRSRGGIP